MAKRLHEAAIEGNVSTLLELHREHPLLLDTLNLAAPSTTPLHAAALLGHTDFVRQILQLKPQLAHELDSRRSSPLHFAAAKGHLKVVRELVKVDPNLCLIRDADGRNPLQLAAMNARVQALEELVKGKPEAARAVVDQGGNVLHLCVKNNQLESLKLLIKAMEHDTAFLNAKDDYGFTILHLAVSNKQVEIVEFLVNTPGMELNAVNSNGFTPLDVLVQSNRDLKDLDIAESLRAFGAERTTAPSLALKASANPHWLSSERDALMVVASVIATMAFQAGTNPPGGVWQEDKGTEVAGKSIMASKYSSQFVNFIVYATISLILSLIVLYLLIFGYPAKRSGFGVLVYYIIGSAFWSIGMSYWYSMTSLTPESLMSQVNPLLRTQLLLLCVSFGVLLLISLRKMVISKAKELISRCKW